MSYAAVAGVVAAPVEVVAVLVTRLAGAETRHPAETNHHQPTASTILASKEEMRACRPMRRLLEVGVAEVAPSIPRRSAGFVRPTSDVS